MLVRIDAQRGHARDDGDVAFRTRFSAQQIIGCRFDDEIRRSVFELRGGLDAGGEAPGRVGQFRRLRSFAESEAGAVLLDGGRNLPDAARIVNNNADRCRLAECGRGKLRQDNFWSRGSRNDNHRYDDEREDGEEEDFSHISILERGCVADCC